MKISDIKVTSKNSLGDIFIRKYEPLKWLKIGGYDIPRFFYIYVKIGLIFFLICDLIAHISTNAGIGLDQICTTVACNVSHVKLVIV